MKKEFSLQKVLDFRNKRLDIEKAKMRELQNKDKAILTQMQEIALLIEDKEKEMDSDNKAGIFGFADLYVKFIGLKKNELTILNDTRKQILNQIEAQKAVLNKALKEVKIMEKLKEKHLIAYAHFLKKQEDFLIDELNITRGKHEDD